MSSRLRQCRGAARRGLCVAALVVGVASTAVAQVLVDRVLARVNGHAVALSDVRAGLAMGLVVAPGDELMLATEQWVQRQLLLVEVERFPPPEPDAASIEREGALMRARMRSALTSAGRADIDDRQILQSARETLRIRAYLDQRFGVTVQVSDEEARAFYLTHAGEFARDGVVGPFEQVESAVRPRASVARRQATIDQWMADLRQRADVVMNPTTGLPAQP